MSARNFVIASLTLAGLCVTGSAWAQPASPDQPQPYQPQPAQAQPYQPQPYQPQPYQPQPYQPQPYQPQPYQPQAQPQPYYPPAQPTYTQSPRGVVRYVNRPRVGLIIAGAVTLGASWLLTSAAAATNSVSSYSYSYDYYGNPVYDNSSSGSFGYASQVWPLYIPVLGPWIEMGFLSGSNAGLGDALLAFDGLVQAGGLAMIIAGAVTRTKVAIYATNKIRVTPLVLSGSSGVLVSGRF